MFTKQYYLTIAKILNKSENKQEIIEGLSEYFKDDNPLFSRYKFKEASGYNSSKGGE